MVLLLEVGNFYPGVGAGDRRGEGGGGEGGEKSSGPGTPASPFKEKGGISAFILMGFVSKGSAWQVQGSKCPQASNKISHMAPPSAKYGGN